MIGLPQRKRIPPGPDEAALWWATLRQSDPARFADDGRFEDWLAEPTHAQAWHDYDRRLELIDGFAAMPEIRSMRETALAAVKPRQPSWTWPAAGALLAASLVALLVWTEAPVPRFGMNSQGTVAASMRRYSSDVGKRRHVLLADGSKIALDTGSTIEVRYSPERRDIRLLAGQAFFQVAHNSARPFIVAAGNRTVTATGTAFDVKVEGDGRVTVLLVEGHVHVDPVNPAGLARFIPAVARTPLDPGQRLTALPTADPIVDVADVQRDTAWQRGVLIFRKDRLGQAVEQMNRYAATQMVIEDRRLDDLSISGVFPTDSQQDFVAAVTAFYPVEAERRAGGTIALRWRPDAKAQPD